MGQSKYLQQLEKVRKNSWISSVFSGFAAPSNISLVTNNGTINPNAFG